MRPPKLKTKRYKLSHYEDTHEDRFVEMGLDPLSIKFMGGASGIEAEERAMFKKIQSLYDSDGTRWFWIWAITQKNILCGHLELKETEHTNEDELEIVFVVHPDKRGEGIMTEVLQFLKSHQHNWKRRIISTVSPNNKASMALMNKWGIEKREVIEDEEDGDYYKLTLS